MKQYVEYAAKKDLLQGDMTEIANVGRVRINIDLSRSKTTPLQPCVAKKLKIKIIGLMFVTNSLATNILNVCVTWPERTGKDGGLYDRKNYFKNYAFVG